MGVRRFVERPRVVEAVQYDGRNARIILDFVDLALEAENFDLAYEPYEGVGAFEHGQVQQ